MANIDALLRAAKRRHGIFEMSGHDPDARTLLFGPPLHLAPPPAPMRKTLVPDGPARHPVLGGGVAQHPIMPIFKPRRPRRS